MKWESILKFGPRQIPKPSLGSKGKENTMNTDIKPIPFVNKKFVVSLTARFNDGPYGGKWITLWRNDIQKFDTKDDAKEFLIQTMFERGNPDPWTVEGSNERGTCIVYDGVFEVLGAPAYKYYIHYENEELPDPIGFNAKVSNSTREAVLDRFDGNPYGTTKREDSND